MKKLTRVWISAMAILVAADFILLGKIEYTKKENQKNADQLNQVFPGFNDQTLDVLKQELTGLKERLLGLSLLFTPKVVSPKKEKDYDLTILFAEELNNANQLLKNKSQEKQVAFSNLGFSDKLPAESEAALLLSELYCLKETVNLGMDLGIGLKSVKLLKEEKPENIPEVSIAKSALELFSTKEAFTDFLIQLNNIVPRPFLNAIQVKAEGNYFNINLGVDSLLLTLNLPLDLKPAAAVKDEKAKLAEDAYVAILRSRNPFSSAMASPQAGPEAPVSVAAQPKKPTQRFFYRGQANLRGKEVAVLEDTLSAETVFLGAGEKYADYKLKDFSNSQLTLEKLEDGTEISIKKEEE